MSATRKAYSSRKAFGYRVGLRAVAMGGAMALLCWPLTTPAGIAAAAVGGVLGVIWGNRAGHGRLRLGSGLGLALVGAVFAVALTRGLVGWSPVASTLGPLGALAVGEVVRWFGLVLATVFALRLLAVRSLPAAAFEVLAVALAVTATVIAHRGGMVHRPLPIGDWAWSRGIDPGIILLAVGGLASLVLAAMLFDRRLPDRRSRSVSLALDGMDDEPVGWRRRLLHFSALVLVALFLLFFIRTIGPPAPQAGGDLGLTGDPAEADEDPDGKEGGEGQRDGRKDDQLGDIPFKNEYSSGGNEAPVAVVVLHDDYAPPSGVFYFRQSAFSQYNGRRLVQATREGVDGDIVARFPSEVQAIENAPPLGEKRMALPTSIGLLAEHVRPFALDAPAELKPIRNPNPTRFRRAFAARSHVQTVHYEDIVGSPAGNAGWDDSQWRHYTEAPVDDRYRALASKLIERLKPEFRDDPLARALAIKGYLDEQGIYSRKSGHADAGDPTGSFLFGDLTGYCVHFAHAATYLFRSLDIPARVAAGYAVPEDDRAGGSALMIRGLNAHAWPEVYLDDVGWVVVDPAPQQTLDEVPQSPDQTLQRMLGEMLRDQPPQPDLEPSLIERLSLAALAGWLLIAVMAASLLSYLIKIYRQVVPMMAPGVAAYRLTYRAALDQLAEVGLRRRFGETRERFARRSEARAPSFARLSALHVGVALGSRHATSAEDWHAMTGRVRKELGESTPTWRRLLGTLDPFSWLRAR